MTKATADGLLDEVRAQFARLLVGEVGQVTNFINETELEYRRLILLAETCDTRPLRGSPLAVYCSLARTLGGPQFEESYELTRDVCDAYQATFGHRPPYPWMKVACEDLLRADPSPGGGV